MRSFCAIKTMRGANRRGNHMPIIITDRPEERDQLTELERALLEKLCEGRTFAQIDEELNLQPGFAHRRIRKRLFRKIGVCNRHEAVAVTNPTSHVKQSELRQCFARWNLTKRETGVLLLLFRFP